LQLTLLADTRQPAARRRQAALAQAGVAAEHDGHTWHIGPAQVAEKAQASDE
jgi:general secretion pathway protein L